MTDNIFEYLSEKHPEILKEFQDQETKTQEKTESKENNFDKIDTKKLLEENMKLKGEQEVIRTKLHSLAQEFQNYIQKSEQNNEELKLNTTRKFASEIISLFNIIDLAKKSCQNDANMLIGMEMLEKQFLDILSRFNIIKIEIKEGDVFDENICEAVDQKSGGKTNTIAKINSFPFKIKDKLLVAGRVEVFI